MIRNREEIGTVFEAIIEQLPSDTLATVSPLLADLESSFNEAVDNNDLLRRTLNAVLGTFQSYVEES